MSRLFVASVAVVVTTACSSGDAPSSNAPRNPPNAQTAAPESPPTPHAQTATPEHSGPQQPQANTQTATALREARAMARTGRFEEAWTRLEPFATPSATPAFRCEAGYVAFRAGHLDRAVPLIRGAVDSYATPTGEGGEEGAREARASLARCLYNVGMVSEAAGDLPAAVAAYQRSFSLRANRTVYQHLVQASAHAASASDEAHIARVTEALHHALGPSPTMEALAQGFTDYCTLRPYHPLDCTATFEGRWSAPSDSGALLEAALIRTEEPRDVFLAVRDAAGARVVASLLPNYGNADLHVDHAQFEEVVPPRGLELVLDVTQLTYLDSLPGNDCDPEEDEGCMGSRERIAERFHIVCAPLNDELACVAIPTLETRYFADGFDHAPACDLPAPALPCGIGWEGTVHFDAAGNLSTSAHAVTSACVACPELEAPQPNELESGPNPPTARVAVPFATLMADPALQLSRRFPEAPTPRVPQTLAFASPWAPPYHQSAAPVGALTALTESIENACEIEVENYAPRCCPWESDCTARVEMSAHAEGDEFAIVRVTCPHAESDADGDQQVRVITHGAVGGEHRVIGTLQAQLLDGGTLQPITHFRVEDALSTPGHEARFSFRSDVLQPATDELTHVDAESRSITDVEVICTGGTDARCYGIPSAYRGSQVGYAEDGHTAVIGRTSYRVDSAVHGSAITFTTVEGTPPATLTGTHTLEELEAFQVRPWRVGEPEYDH